jgi:hypothetical protein
VKKISGIVAEMAGYGNQQFLEPRSNSRGGNRYKLGGNPAAVSAVILIFRTLPIKKGPGFPRSL